MTSYDIHDERVMGRIKLVFISDTHSCSFGGQQAELVEKMAAEEPDLILLGGDIIDDVLPMERGLETVEQLARLSSVVCNRKS